MNDPIVLLRLWWHFFRTSRRLRRPDPRGLTFHDRRLIAWVRELSRTPGYLRRR